ncbi:molybdopterin-dependent oxidoreductase [Nocardioides sp.]|uniref:molybdopterin-dependent oxidoreductase n=1 Tax=Nocardioides sp. TaxID=35761 RepID=UPI0035118601
MDRSSVTRGSRASAADRAHPAGRAAEAVDGELLGSDADESPARRPRWWGVAAAVAMALVALSLVGAVVNTLRDEPTRAPVRAASTTEGAVRVSPAAPHEGALPAPTGPVVLTLRDVPRPNVGRDLRLDLALLDSLGTWQLEADDRQATGRRARFTGPLLRDVLAAAGIDGRGARALELHTVALNDYRVDIPVRDALEMPVLLATRTDGRTMSVAAYGPTRVIYPTSGYDLDPSIYEPRWIWQLTSMTVS